MRRIVSHVLVLCLISMCGCLPQTTPTAFDMERFGVTQAEVEEQHQKYGKLQDGSKIGDEYALDSLIVMVYPFAYHINYTPKDFAEIGCFDVIVLSEGDLEKDGPNKILCLKIRPTTKQGILDAVRILEQRPDIYSAGPNHILHIS